MDASNTTFAGLVALGGFASYLVLVRSLRYRRRDKLSRDLGYDGLTEEEIYKKITLDDAQTISHALESQEFPFLNNTSLQFALFRVRCAPFKNNSLVNSDTQKTDLRYPYHIKGLERH